LWSLLLVVGANLGFFWSLATAASSARVTLGEAVIFAQSAIGVSMIAFGGFSWALDGSAAGVAAVLRVEPAMRPAGDLRQGNRGADGTPAREIRLRDVTFAYANGAPVLEHFDLTIPAGSSLAIVGQNGAGKTTIAKLLCRLYDPQAGAVEVDGVDLRDFAVESWRAQGRRIRWCVTPLPPRARRTWPGSTRSWRAATTAGSISRAASGSASRSRGRWP